MLDLNDDGWDHLMVLRTGFGNIHDIGHGWTYDGLVRIAIAIGHDTDKSWDAVTAYAKTKQNAMYPS